MSRLTFTTNTFNCHLTCDQCTYIKPNGQRCGNRVCIGYPMCWIHNKKLYGIRVKDSTIPGGGKGLFATQPIRGRVYICPYVGENITQECLDSRYEGDVTAPYTVFDNESGIYVDSACVRGVGAMANTSRRTNAEIIEREGELWLRATRYIRADEEILVDYGEGYQMENNHTTKRKRGNDTRPC